MYKRKILVVEDDPAITNLITTTLDIRQYHYQTAKTGRGALMIMVSYNPDIVVLDLGLPDMDGVEIIKKIRGFSNTPIIVVSARSEDSDKVEALDAGADDYLTKPFSTDEFLARIRVAIRRKMSEGGQNTAAGNIYTNGALTIDYMAGCAFMDGEEIHLTPIEYKLLCLLAKNTGKVLTHNFILREIWGSAMDSNTSSLRVFMATLRKKIEKDTNNPQYIQTHIGIGYRMMKL